MATTNNTAAPTGQSLSTTAVDVRMYCMGTGDCLVLKFHAAEQEQFTLMIDCGSCVGTATDFHSYLTDLQEFVKNKIDLLVVTHEHNDHVNGFAKCPYVFQGITIKQAWFAWTENPQDPGGKADDLQKKREVMRQGFRKALDKIQANKAVLEQELNKYPYNRLTLDALNSFVAGMQTLGTINLGKKAAHDKALPGMKTIKKILKDVPTKYLSPGNSLSLPELPGVRFHVLGPPLDKKYVYKDGKEGRDVYKRNEKRNQPFAVGEGILAMNAFARLGEPLSLDDLPFDAEYLVDEHELDQPVDPNDLTHPLNTSAYKRRYVENLQKLRAQYHSSDNHWRTIENEWLYTAGSLAIRLDSHINNTSLALAIELGQGGPVLLLPGDAEFGSWESWHLIEQWNGLGPGGKHFVEDLLNRTVFYKVAHHLSYNGTALDKGIRMMNSPELASMVTLDRERISEKWKSTMPNHELLRELIRRCQGKCFIMNEKGIDNPPSAELDPSKLSPDQYQVIWEDEATKQRVLAKQYTVRL